MIARYDLTESPYYGDKMRESPNGDYILYADLPRVHDLRKDPSDLPTERLPQHEQQVLALRCKPHPIKRDTLYEWCVAIYRHQVGWYVYMWADRVYINDVIAWQELPDWRTEYESH